MPSLFPPALDPAAALERLASCRAPFLIGVRHHSPAGALAIPGLLDDYRPERILLELPPEFTEWLPWLAHHDAVAPLALAAAGPSGDPLFFYPYADFSPELAMLRWAARTGVPVELFDLPAAQQAVDGPPERWEGIEGLMQRWMHLTEASDFESLWDREVEAGAAGQGCEAVRRAALLVGWAQRASEAGDGLRRRDLARESHMRSHLETCRGQRVAAVVGTFHAAALLEPPEFWRHVPATAASDGLRTSLVPYSFELLDSRSGYPAGIRDPVWQQRVWEGGDFMTDLAVQVCREVRRKGHAAGLPDARETVRLALDLARLRALPAAGRREFLEAVASALAQGELLGRGRVVAAALEQTLIGFRRGRLAPGTPRSGLGPHLLDLLSALRLPGPDTPPVKGDPGLRLDPLRSSLDRSRHVALCRLQACGIPYATRRESTGETLTHVWVAAWTPGTEAMVELSGLRGVTLAQAARGSLRAEERRLHEAGHYGPSVCLAGLTAAAECGLTEAVTARLDELMGPFLGQAGLAEVVAAITLLDKMVSGHVPGLPAEADGVPALRLDAFRLPDSVRRDDLVAAAVKAVDGLAGSDQVADVRALQELVQLLGSPHSHQGGWRSDQVDETTHSGRLDWALQQLVDHGSPLMQGAAGAARVLLGTDSSEALGQRLGSWVDGATHPDGRRALARRLQGALLLAAPLFETHAGLVAELLGRVGSLDEDAFLGRLPALREGFEALSPAARGRLLESLGGEGAVGVDESPLLLARFAAADALGRRAVAAWGLEIAAGVGVEAAVSERHLDVDRWRLILGRQRDRVSGRAARAARALDELYGRGHGEGSRQGGPDASFPSVREWSAELDDLFGATLRQEVLGRAAVAGRAAALLDLEPDEVVPSVELLQQVLSLKGGMPEAQMDRLRRLVEHVVRALTEALAKRVAPALTGLSTPRPTRRPTSRLDLPRTLRANLRTLRPSDTGWTLVPEQLIFRTRARRSLDWRVVLVVDVSGSMEASVIYSAVMAAILAGLPAISIHFVAFSTEVMDLSEHVSDPLGLLLEVSVGGGTDVAQALRYARSLLTVPARSLVVLVSDFEEGGPVEALVEEVRTLVETGARPLGLAALDDRGQPRFCAAVAEQVVAAGMPVAALTPLELAHWVHDQICS